MRWTKADDTVLLQNMERDGVYAAPSGASVAASVTTELEAMMDER